MRIFAVLFAAVAAPVLASTLEVGPGETYTVAKEQQRMVLSSLKLGDGATVRFAEGVTLWQIRAERAEIGSDVTVDGRGQAGQQGTDGQHAPQAAACKDGESGAVGGHGQDGQQGVSVRMQVGLVSLGSLTIQSDGGAGGVGGRGGNGAAGADFEKSCASAPAGGDAGAGGNGGRAGNAGDVTVQYWAAVKGLNLNAVDDLVSVTAKAGEPGAAGKSGEAGAGSEGHYINRRTLSGNRKWVAGGDEGQSAAAAQVGAVASNGKVLIEQPLMVAPITPVPAAAPSQSVKTVDTTGNEDEVDELKRELRALMQRLEKLEAK